MEHQTAASCNSTALNPVPCLSLACLHGLEVEVAGLHVAIVAAHAVGKLLDAATAWALLRHGRSGLQTKRQQHWQQAMFSRFTGKSESGAPQSRQLCSTNSTWRAALAHRPTTWHQPPTADLAVNHTPTTHHGSGSRGAGVLVHNLGLAGTHHGIHGTVSDGTTSAHGSTCRCVSARKSRLKLRVLGPGGRRTVRAAQAHHCRTASHASNITATVSALRMAPKEPQSPSLAVHICPHVVRSPVTTEPMMPDSMPPPALPWDMAGGGAGAAWRKAVVCACCC